MISDAMAKAVLYLSGAMLILLVAGAAVYGPKIQDLSEKPDRAKMRAYRMSQLTDDQVLELHKRAEDDSELQRRSDKEADEASRRQRNEEMSKCEADPVQKLRSPTHCMGQMPLFAGSYEELSEPAEQLFEDYVMGSCEWVTNVFEAKQRHCLPDVP
jgi:hypothetical protein